MIENRHPIFELSPGHEIIDKEIIIPDKNQITEDEYEEEMLNSNIEEIECETIEMNDT